MAYVDSIEHIKCRNCGNSAIRKIIHKDELFFLCEKHFNEFVDSGVEIFYSRNFVEIQLQNGLTRNGNKLFRSSSIATPFSAKWGRLDSFRRKRKNKWKIASRSLLSAMIKENGSFYSEFNSGQILYEFHDQIYCFISVDGKPGKLQAKLDKKFKPIVYF